VKVVFLALVWVYRRLLSPVYTALTGPACRFEPTCSAYAEEAVRTHGAWRGAGLALHRLLRCHPFAKAGFDPVPANRASEVDRVERRPASPVGAHRGRFGTL
jgi:putative membrane protein insertion efficiency factor